MMRRSEIYAAATAFVALLEQMSVGGARNSSESLAPSLGQRESLTLVSGDALGKRGV